MRNENAVERDGGFTRNEDYVLALPLTKLDALCRGRLALN